MKKRYQQPLTLSVQIGTCQMLATSTGSEKLSTPSGAPTINGPVHEEDTPDDLEIDAKGNFDMEW